MKTRQFDIITIFPEMFESPFGESILKRAQDQELLNIDLHDLRNYTLDFTSRMRGSDEGQEGLSSFLDKRQPNWKPEELE